MMQPRPIIDGRPPIPFPPNGPSLPPNGPPMPPNGPPVRPPFLGFPGMNSNFSARPPLPPQMKPSFLGALSSPQRPDPRAMPIRPAAPIPFKPVLSPSKPPVEAQAVPGGQWGNPAVPSGPPTLSNPPEPAPQARPPSPSPPTPTPVQPLKPALKSALKKSGGEKSPPPPSPPSEDDEYVPTKPLLSNPRSDDADSGGGGPPDDLVLIADAIKKMMQSRAGELGRTKFKFVAKKTSLKVLQEYQAKCKKKGKKIGVPQFLNPRRKLKIKALISKYIERS